MDDFLYLSDLLLRQVLIYAELLDLENDKKRLLVKGKAQELETFINKEQALIMQSCDLEKKRLDLQKRLGAGKMKLSQIIEKYSPNDEYGLKTVHFKLSHLLKEIKKVNSINMRLIHSRLDVMRYLNPEYTVYGKQMLHNEGVNFEGVNV